MQTPAGPYVGAGRCIYWLHTQAADGIITSSRRSAGGDPRGIPLIAHAQIQLEVDKPLVSPVAIDLPAGL